MTLTKNSLNGKGGFIGVLETMGSIAMKGGMENGVKPLAQKLEVDLKQKYKKQLEQLA